MADTCTAKSNSNRHSTNNDVTPTKRLPQHKVEPSTSSGEKVGGSSSIDCCTDPYSCMTLYDILKSFNAPVSEEQMWALIYQSVKLYRDALQHSDYSFKDLRAPASTHNLNIHKDGSVHISFGSNDPGDTLSTTSQKQILFQIGLVVYEAWDYNLSENNTVSMSCDLEQLISKMTLEDVDDEGIERDSDDVEDYKSRHTKDLDHILDFCTPRVQPTNPNEHYKAVCRALATETCELRAFLQTVYHGETDHLRLNADVETSKFELQKLEFADWPDNRIVIQARFWMQVVDELRRGVRLKKHDLTRPSIEFQMTPYEALMQDIRNRKYNLRKVMVNGDVPPKVKKDAHALILEFIRSRPPLKKASDRTLPPARWNPTPRENLLESIRDYRKNKKLKQISPRVQAKSLPPSQGDVTKISDQKHSNPKAQDTTTKQRLIHVDYDLFKDIDQLDESGTSSLQSNQSFYSESPNQYQIFNNDENNPNDINTAVVHRRKKEPITQDDYHQFCDYALESYDLATQCESRRASLRRHTIVGCHSNPSNPMECQSTPSSRPESRHSEISTTATMNPLNPHNPMTAATIDEWIKDSVESLNEQEWKETVGVSDRLALTLEEIVHIRSVMTKAELEGLPVGIRVKEDVERRKVCFLCLRTRFTIFGQWGVKCKLCQRTVCSKCYSKMRIPTEHFRNVPVVLLSPSLMTTPVTSTAPSPSHHAHLPPNGSANVFDDAFPRSLLERLMRTETQSKGRQTIASVPSSPKYSSSCTPSHAQVNGTTNKMTCSMGGLIDSNPSNSGLDSVDSTNSNRNSIMSRSMEGPHSLPPQSPARPYSTNSTLDRRNRFSRAFTQQSGVASNIDHKDLMRGEMMDVCNDCKGLVYEIIRSSKQTRSSARNKALRNLTLDLSPVYKRW
ncbi:protein spire isoform X1 [Bradysia coprophila]|uniref:protein spire isoform X1 n=1 Tax=Bradysia coprophila TaxID=38358 RepID=UPI00187DD71B|nr:protein spire isoform X1 [Bradysia coprophila]